LKIPPIAGTCAALQVKCFVKWRKSNCIIKDLIKFIPVLSHNSWTKESNILRKKNSQALTAIIVKVLRNSIGITFSNFKVLKDKITIKTNSHSIDR